MIGEENLNIYVQEMKILIISRLLATSRVRISRSCTVELPLSRGVVV